jgi:8-amino-7-oxononanoate synthase
MPADNPLEARVRERLADLQAQGLMRTMRSPAGVDLSSNDYLALSTHPRVAAAFSAAVHRDGVGSTGSRLLRGERDAFSGVEREFAAFKGTARSLFFSSGYLANMAVVSTFCEARDVIFSDERNHASLIDGIRLSRASRVVFPHNDVGALTRLIEATPCSGTRFVIVESLFSMDGDEAPLAAYAALSRATGAQLIVDEAHAVGVRGAAGTGLVEEAGIAADVFASINTAGKALGVGGAFVAGAAWPIEYLVQRARPFIFSTAAPPAMAAAIGASLAVIREEPERRARLHALASHLRAQLRARGLDVASGPSQIVPIHIGDNEAAVSIADAMQADGFDVRAIRPPSVAPGHARLRVSVNTRLGEATLDRFVERLTKALQEAGLCSAVSS